MNSTVLELLSVISLTVGPQVLSCNYINVMPMVFYGIDTKVQTVFLKTCPKIAIMSLLVIKRKHSGVVEKFINFSNSTQIVKLVY